jgi:hypothetical protein
MALGSVDVCSLKKELVRLALYKKPGHLGNVIPAWIAGQICREQICKNPKGAGQDSPA